MEQLGLIAVLTWDAGGSLNKLSGILFIYFSNINLFIFSTNMVGNQSRELTF